MLREPLFLQAPGASARQYAWTLNPTAHLPLRLKLRADAHAQAVDLVGFFSTYSVGLGRKVKNYLIVVLAGVGMALGGAANAQTASSQANDPHVISNQDLELLRKDIRSQKKQLVAANLKLTDAEATKFWPVYDRYTADLIKINDKKFGLIQDYADHWGTMTDEQSSSFLRQWLDVDISIAQLRQKYVPEVAQVLNGRKTATFFQLDRRISMMIDLQLASQVPIVQAQE
jgi:hypothetical protein